MLLWEREGWFLKRRRAADGRVVEAEQGGMI
jgi:hypothetical protein